MNAALVVALLLAGAVVLGVLRTLQATRYRLARIGLQIAAVLLAYFCLFPPATNEDFSADELVVVTPGAARAQLACLLGVELRDAQVLRRAVPRKAQRASFIASQGLRCRRCNRDGDAFAGARMRSRAEGVRSLRRGIAVCGRDHDQYGFARMHSIVENRGVSQCKTARVLYRRIIARDVLD